MCLKRLISSDLPRKVLRKKACISKSLADSCPQQHRLIHQASHVLIVCCLPLLLGGCIPLTPFFDDPLPKERLQGLTIGASKEDVRSLLGSPQAIRDGGRYWYYGGIRPALAVLNTAYDDYKWIEVEFDDASRLFHVEHYEAKWGCASSGNCLLSWGTDYGMSNSAVITAPPALDEIAKQFLPPKDGCAVYVYYDAGFLMPIYPIPVRVNNETRWLNQDTYTRFEMMPGEAQIVFDGDRLEAVERWHCNVGEVTFTHLFSRWTDKLTVYIESVDEAVSRKEILKRRLLLPP